MPFRPAGSERGFIGGGVAGSKPQRGASTITI